MLRELEHPDHVSQAATTCRNNRTRASFVRLASTVKVNHSTQLNQVSLCLKNLFKTIYSQEFPIKPFVLVGFIVPKELVWTGDDVHRVLTLTMKDSKMNQTVLYVMQVSYVL